MINPTIKDGRTYVNINELTEWENNPRTISEDNFKRLKALITKFGQFKPLIVNKEGIVLGGNMRLRAYRELELTDIWVSVVDAETEEKKIEIALADNDRVGQYSTDEIANMVGNFPSIDWKQFSIDLSMPLLVQDLIDQQNYDPKKEWKDMPEFNQEGTDFYKMIIVRCLTKEDYEKFAKSIGQTLTEKTKSIWYPEQDFDSNARDERIDQDEDA